MKNDKIKILMGYIDIAKHEEFFEFLGGQRLTIPKGGLFHLDAYRINKEEFDKMSAKEVAAELKCSAKYVKKIRCVLSRVPD